MAVGSFKLPISGSTTTSVDWVRPSDWLAMPTIGTQEFIGLLAITEDGSNDIALLCAGAYTVDWGDGTSQNIATGVKAEHSYTYSSISSSTLSSRGYKQVLVRVTPQSGQNLTTVNLQQRNAIINKLHSVAWLDIAVNGANITTLAIGGTSTVYVGMCENVTIGSIGAITSFSSLCYNMSSLQSVSIANSATVTNFSGMFTFCYSLRTVSLFNTANGTNMSGMFTGCFSLVTIPLFNTVLNQQFQNMFDSCYALRDIPLINTVAGTNFSSMFVNCRNLQTIPLINTIAGTTFTSMFNGAYSIQTLPNLNTAAGTVFTNMLSGTVTLAKGAFQGTRYTISYSGMCLSQTAIVDIFNGLGTAVGTPTITVSSNPGYAALTAAERLIATNKGFTIA